MLAALAVASWAAGCASYSGYGLKPGISTEAEVRGTMGAPAAEFVAADGSRQLAYPRGPLGTRTFMAEVGPDRVLRSVKQVLDDDTFYRIQPGLTREEVMRLIGPPGETMSFPLSGNYAWDYRYVDTWGYLAIFSVTFDRNGIVVSKISQRIDRDRSLF
jgi:SmpA/OmlA family protein